MTVFWIMAALLASLAGLMVLTGARRGHDAGDGAMRTAAAAELAELDRLKARGLLAEADWTAARAEAGRRVLAGERVETAAAPRPRDRVWVLAALGVAAAGALGLYFTFGAPGYDDQAYRTRVDAWMRQSPETLDAPQMAAVFARVVERAPRDHQALTLLGAARFEAGDPLGAASAFRRAIEQQPTDAQSWARLGESLVRANGGEIGGDAEAAFARALALDSDQLGARYFLGEAALRRGDANRVRTLWTPLIAALDPRDPRRADLERRLPRGDGGRP